jgi:hypothetical protein
MESNFPSHFLNFTLGLPLGFILFFLKASDYLGIDSLLEQFGPKSLRHVVHILL